MEAVGLSQPDSARWAGKRVLVTGHTGFKGGWLCHWLRALGAEVYGYALAPATEPNLYTLSALEAQLVSTIGDLRDAAAVTACVQSAQPEIIFHLAAQPLVRPSYRDPVATYATNVMGTVHLLEAVRLCPSVRAVVNITTDKCYENLDTPRPYRESDALGGYDPYSSSKACAEIVSAAWRRSFLADAGIALATARAGNVIGGGDWSPERLLPDILRSFAAGETLHLRYPQAVRPWQHVLEPLCGYLLLAERLLAAPTDFAEAWNFGPDESDALSVEAIVALASRRWQDGDPSAPAPRWTTDTTPQPHEAGLLRLDSTQARSRLGWQPRWRVETAIARTLDWHHAWRRGADMADYCRQQIIDYLASPAA